MKQRNPRLVARISGGLGNQLFMYAAARRLAVASGADLALDVSSGFRGDPYRRSYVLPDLSVSTPAAGRWESYSEPMTGRAREVLQLVRLRTKLGPRLWIVDSPYEVDPAIVALRLERDAYQRGYFQSELYFAEIADELRSELRYVSNFSEASSDVADKIRSAGPSAVGVHARVLYSLPQVNDVSALPSARSLDDAGAFRTASYFQRAAAVVEERVDRPHFFIFGDHPTFVADRLALPGPTTAVGHNSHAGAAEDLWLLSRCAHHIVCESTFGWWGAWLGEHSGQVVVAPSSGYPNKSMIPDRWQQVAVD